MSSDLEKLNEWLKENKVEAVAMESTVVYWKPRLIFLSQISPCLSRTPNWSASKKTVLHTALVTTISPNEGARREP